MGIGGVRSEAAARCRVRVLRDGRWGFAAGLLGFGACAFVGRAK